MPRVQPTAPQIGGAGSKLDDVHVGAAAEIIPTGAAIELVTPRPTDQDVVAAVSFEQITGATAVERVIA